MSKGTEIDYDYGDDDLAQLLDGSESIDLDDLEDCTPVRCGLITGAGKLSQLVVCL